MNSSILIIVAFLIGFCIFYDEGFIRATYKGALAVALLMVIAFTLFVLAVTAVSVPREVKNTGPLFVILFTGLISCYGISCLIRQT